MRRAATFTAYALALAVTAGATGSVHAEIPPIKLDVLRDCAAATRQVDELDESGAIEFVPFLKSILSTRSDIPDTAVRLPVPFGFKMFSADVPYDGVHDPQLWTSSDPQAQANAKRCAISILERLAPFSIFAVPELLRLEAEPTQNAELRNQARTAADNIVSIAKTSSAAWFRNDIYRELIEVTSVAGSSHARDIILSLGPVSTRALLTLLPSLPKERRDLVTELALLLSEHLDETQLITLFTAPDEDVRWRAAIMIQSKAERTHTLSAPTITALTNSLDESSERVRLELFETLTLLDDKTIKPHLAKIPPHQLASQLRLASPGGRDALTRLIARVARVSKDADSAAIDLLNESDQDIKIRALQILAALPQLSNKAFDACVAKLRDPNPAIVVATIDALGRHKERARGILTAFQQLTAPPKGGKAEPQRAEVVAAIAHATISLNLQARALPLARFFITNFPENERDTAVVISALRAMGDGLKNSVISTLADREAATRFNALRILVALDLTGRQALTAVAKCAADEEGKVRDLARQFLTDKGRGDLIPRA